MDFHEITMKGKFWGQILTTKPAWTNGDEGRIIYVQDTGKTYIGQSSDWASFTYNDYGYVWLPAENVRPGGSNLSVGHSLVDDGDYLIPLNLYGISDRVNLLYWLLDGGPGYASEVYGTTQFSDWDLGTVKAKFYWTGATGCSISDDVRWGLELLSLGDSDVLDGTKGTIQYIDDSVLANDGTDIQITAATPAITVGGTPATNDLISVTVSRPAIGSNDMTEDALFFGVLIQYKKTINEGSW